MRISQAGDVVTLINVFDTTSEHQQTLIDLWIRFSEAVKDEPGFMGAALHKSKDGTRVINYAHWRSEADFQNFVRRHGAEFAQFSKYASRVDPHTYDVVYLYERPGS
jgi:heme-degrading monooxygenase HmoA